MANQAGEAHPHEQTDKTTGFVYLAAALAAITGLLFGLDTGGISGTIPFITQTFSLSTLMTEVVTATVLVGAVIGAAVSGRLADTLGRRKLIIIMGVVFVVAIAPKPPHRRCTGCWPRAWWWASASGRRPLSDRCISQRLPQRTSADGWRTPHGLVGGQTY